MCVCMCLSLSLYIYIYIYNIYIYIYTHIHVIAGVKGMISKPKTKRRGARGQFSKAQSGKMGPAPGRFELSKGTLK